MSSLFDRILSIYINYPRLRKASKEDVIEQLVLKVIYSSIEMFKFSLLHFYFLYYIFTKIIQTILLCHK